MCTTIYIYIDGKPKGIVRSGRGRSLERSGVPIPRSSPLLPPPPPPISVPFYFTELPVVPFSVALRRVARTGLVPFVVFS